MVFCWILVCEQDLQMATDLHATLAKTLSSHLTLSKSRIETMVLLLIGMLSARTVNLGHIASERGSSVKHASTYSNGIMF